jgi:hypothetical protein
MRLPGRTGWSHLRFLQECIEQERIPKTVIICRKSSTLLSLNELISVEFECRPIQRQNQNRLSQQTRATGRLGAIIGCLDA